LRVEGAGDRWARSALARELGRVAAAHPPAPGRAGERNGVLWEAARNLYNLVAAGALDAHEVEQGLLDAAGRCGLLADEPRQTHRTLASAREVGMAHPAAHPTVPRPSAPRKGGDATALTPRQPATPWPAATRHPGGGRGHVPGQAGRAHPTNHPQEDP
jgi:hypothetical protein